MNNWLTYLLLAFCIFGLIACGDLEENLIDEVTKDISVPGPPYSVGDPGPNPYSDIRNLGMANHGSYYSIQEIASDEMFIGGKGSDWSSDVSAINLHRHTYTPNNNYINFTWTNLYNGIDFLNTYIVNFWVEPEQQSEAKALRAFYYMGLLDLFGRVKLITENDPNPPQVSRVEVFEFVERELLEILGVNELSNPIDWSGSLLYDGDNVYRINRYAALGFLAKLYLNAEVYTGEPMYDKAEIAASLIIDSGRYQLCGQGCVVRNLGKRLGVNTDPEMLEGFPAVFAPNNEDNPEHIFAINYDERSYWGMNFSQMNLHYASQRSWRLAEQPWNGYATLEEFYNSYDDSDERKQASFLAGPQLDFEGSAILDYQFDDEDIHLHYTPFVNELTPNMQRQAGARPAKFSYKLFGRSNMDNDFPLLRLGEMYLIRAEARARQTGSWQAAELDVNVLRARAEVPTYSGNLTAEEFLAERGREMFQETVRRTDLIRFGKYNDAWWEKPVSEPYRNVFPIPLQQLNFDPGLTQNPGY